MQRSPRPPSQTVIFNVILVLRSFFYLIFLFPGASVPSRDPTGVIGPKITFTKISSHSTRARFSCITTRPPGTWPFPLLLVRITAASLMPGGPNCHPRNMEVLGRGSGPIHTNPSTAPNPISRSVLSSSTDRAVPTVPGLAVISDLLYPSSSKDLNLRICPVPRKSLGVPDSRPDGGYVMRFVSCGAPPGVIHQLLLRGEHLSPRRIFSRNT